LAGSAGASMNKRRISWLMAAIAVPALVFGAMASTAFAEKGIDPKKAKDLIPIVLVIDDTVLPGSNWTLIRDDFTENALPKTTACNNSLAKLNTLSKGLESQLAAKGSLLAVQDPEPGQYPLAVSTEIYVYKSESALATAFKDLKTIYTGNDMAPCLVSLFEADVSGATGKKIEPYLPAANSDIEGAAVAAEIKASQLIDPVRVEHYAAINGNTLVMMTFLGPAPLVDKDGVTFLLQLEAAAIELVSGY